MTYWIGGGVVLGAIFNFLIPYLVGGGIILLALSLINACKFDKKLAKEDPKTHKKFMKKVKVVSSGVILARLSGLIIFAIYGLIWKAYGVDLSTLRIIVGILISGVIYGILWKKGFLGFASSEEKLKTLK